ncbi:unnamed protein product [Chironomus riparius]|uniref:Lipoprotein n=1 Tax=Chironomus riparius TaxID=315576 RepID=A0A9N9RL98_9DIPT|nr:unnamed protein product [Chironomus riparius]
MKKIDMKVVLLIVSFVIIGCYSLPIDEMLNMNDIDVNNIDVNDILTNIPDNFEINEEISGILKRIGDIIFNEPVNIFDGPLHCPDGTKPSGSVCKPIY